MSSLLDTNQLQDAGDSAEPPVSGRGVLNIYPVQTPAGPGWIGLDKRTVVWLSIGSLDREALEAYWPGTIRDGKRCPLGTRQLEEAAHGRGDIRLAPIGTRFQVAVWKELMRIPFSATKTYGDVAAALGSPGRARAVGSAAGANPVAWLIPCHRVVPARGGPGAYRWGAENKRKLLDWEAVQADEPSGMQSDDRKRLEAMLLKAQRIEDIAKLAGDIAHDLNNLLAPIRMATDLLKRKMADEALDRYVDIIETSTGRARSVIQEILTFSRETENEDATVIQVEPLIRELEKICRETFPERIHLTFNYGTDIPPVRMDPTQFHRAFLNILVNARDAMKGNGHISLDVSVHDLEMQVCVGERCLIPGRHLCISVSDTGCGIPEEIREQIFDPFFTTKPKEQGTGLGLASVYGIVARAGGFIDLESTVGKGSTFHVFLPQAPPKA